MSIYRFKYDSGKFTLIEKKDLYERNIVPTFFIRHSFLTATKMLMLIKGELYCVFVSKSICIFHVQSGKEFFIDNPVYPRQNITICDYRMVTIDLQSKLDLSQMKEQDFRTEWISRIYSKEKTFRDLFIRFDKYGYYRMGCKVCPFYRLIGSYDTRILGYIVCASFFSQGLVVFYTDGTIFAYSL